MHTLFKQAQEFQREKAEIASLARQRSAFFLSTGVDLDETLARPPCERRPVIQRLRRLIEKERLKGAARHWSYDLNRHIALKAALNTLSAPPA